MVDIPFLRCRSDVAERLGAISVVVVGDNAYANQQMAQRLGRALGYVSMDTGAIIEQATGQPVRDIVAAEGPTALAVAELQVASALSTQLRACISTCGGGVGVAAREKGWRYLFGQVAVWLDDNPNGSEEAAPQRGAYGLAEIRVVVPTINKESLDDAARQVLKGIKDYTKRDADMPKRKGLYIKLGCRGDWPNIQHPDWRPDDWDEATDGATSITKLAQQHTEEKGTEV